MNIDPEVEKWIADYVNPQKALLEKVRLAVITADDRVRECVKWAAPTFTYKGNIASFFPRAKANVSLMFHTGSMIVGKFPNLEGEGKEGRVYRIHSDADLVAKMSELQAIIKAWCDQKDGRT